MAKSAQHDQVRIVFLGGLGEIGRNCFCIEVEDRILVVDCGIMFPDADMPGVDLVLPDFTYLRENADRVEGVLLTTRTRTTPAGSRSCCVTSGARSTDRRSRSVWPGTGSRRPGCSDAPR